MYISCVFVSARVIRKQFTERAIEKGEGGGECFVEMYGVAMQCSYKRQTDDFMTV